MTVSTDAQISYGVLIQPDENEEPLPWDYERYGGDIEEWWVYEACEYKNPFELFDEDGDWLPGADHSLFDQLYDAKMAFLKEHPCPVELVNYCSRPYPLYILAVPGSVFTVSRGFPKRIGESTVNVFRPSGKAVDELLEFCEDHSFTVKDGPCWWLSSYWDGP